MEWSNVVQAVVSDLLAQAIIGISALTILGLGAVLGTLLFGRGYKRRIAALEAQAQQPSINQTINFGVNSDGDEYDRQLRTAIDAETSQNLQETMRSLPQMPLGDGHTYARLPEGTNIVSMADGTMRLAIPTEISVSISSGIPTISVSLTTTTDEDQ